MARRACGARCSGARGRSVAPSEHAHPALRQSGIRFVEIQHDACSQASPEEVELIRQLVGNLPTQRYADIHGGVHPRHCCQEECNANFRNPPDIISGFGSRDDRIYMRYSAEASCATTLPAWSNARSATEADRYWLLAHPCKVERESTRRHNAHNNSCSASSRNSSGTDRLESSTTDPYPIAFQPKRSRIVSRALSAAPGAVSKRRPLPPNGKSN